MKIALFAATAASMLALAGCGSEKAPDPTTKSVAPAVVTENTVATPNPTMPGPPVTAENVAKSKDYLESTEIRTALESAAPEVAGVAGSALAHANELAVCRIAFAVKHGETPHAPTDVEKRSAAFDLGTNPKALEECRSRT